MYIKTFEYLRI